MDPINTVKFDVWNDPTFTAGYEDFVADDEWDEWVGAERDATMAFLGVKAA